MKKTKILKKRGATGIPAITYRVTFLAATSNYNFARKRPSVSRGYLLQVAVLNRENYARRPWLSHLLSLCYYRYSHRYIFKLNKVTNAYFTISIIFLRRTFLLVVCLSFKETPVPKLFPPFAPWCRLTPRARAPEIRPLPPRSCWAWTAEPLPRRQCWFPRTGIQSLPRVLGCKNNNK